ncbi:MAG TPA: EamA family transporter [Longimicrobiales bacterium]|nr:EamA family transporter [Longimicrobiales bacterium]
MSARERMLLVAAFGAVWLIWGSTYLAIAWAVESIPPVLMIGARCVLAGGVLHGWSRLRGGVRPSPADWRAAAVAGVLLFVTGQAVLAWAETRIPSGAASLLVATEPLFIALLPWRSGGVAAARGAFGAGVARGGPDGLGTILVGFAGVGVLVLPGVGGGIDPVAGAAVVLAALSWSVGVFRAGTRPGIRAGQMAGMQLLVAGGILLGLAALIGEPGALAATGPSLRSVGAFLYLVVLGSIVAFGAYVWLLDRVGPSRLSTHAYVNPLVAVVLGTLLNGEPMGTGLLLATALILGSVALLLRRPLPAPAAERPGAGGESGRRIGARRGRRQVGAWGRRRARHPLPPPAAPPVTP